MRLTGETSSVVLQQQSSSLGHCIVMGVSAAPAALKQQCSIADGCQPLQAHARFVMVARVMVARDSGQLQ